MYHVCLIPGLGIDQRIFKQLTLDIRFSQTVINWISPYPNENLAHYAARLVNQVPQTGKLILVGISFGGIMAVELYRLVNPALIIIISSVKNQNELPWYYKPAGFLKLPYWLPLGWGKNLPWLQNFIFGATTKSEKQLLRQIIQELHVPYAKWALTQIASWQNRSLIPGLVHIQGTHDKLFPVKFLSNFIPVVEGEHLMILSRGQEISDLINAELQKLIK